MTHPTATDPAPDDEDASARPHGRGTDGAADDQDRKKKKKKKKKKEGRLGSDRGIETMFRTSYMTHVNLSALADSKSNIMISINGLIMSIIIGGVSPKIDTNPWLLIPTSVMLVGCLVSMVYSVQAARPRVSSQLFNLDDVRRSKANILFFGHFVNMTETDYIEGMKDLMKNTDNLYFNMIRDLYGLGQVLALKFRLLRVAYIAFTIGLVSGVVSFIIVYVGIVLFSPPIPPTVPPPAPVP